MKVMGRSGVGCGTGFQPVGREGFLPVHSDPMGRMPISINLNFEHLVKSLHLSLSARASLTQGGGDVGAASQQMGERQGHLQGGHDAILDLLEHQPSAFLLAVGIPRGKKNERHGWCAR